MITSQRELKRAIYSAKQKLKDSDVFISDAYNEFLTQMQHGVTSCTHLGTSSLQKMSEERIAYTDGNDTFINYNSVFTAGKSMQEKHSIFCGLNLHECGHLLFTDFELHKKVIENLKNGVIYPSPLQNPYLDEVERFLKDGYSDYIVQMYHKLDNCVEDGFVDRAVMKVVPGYASCLRYTNSVDRTFEYVSYDEMRAQKKPEHEIFCSMVLFYARHGRLLYDENTASDELLDAFNEIKPIITQAVFEASPLLRKKKTFLVFCYMFHFVQIQHNNSQQSQNGSQGSQQGQQGSGSGSQGQQQGQGNQQGQQGSENGSQGQQQGQGNQQGQQGSESGSQGQQQSQGNQQGQQGSKNGSQGQQQGSEGESQGQQNTQSLQELLSELGNSMPDSEQNEHKNASSPQNKEIEALSSMLNNSEIKPTEKEQPIQNPGSTENSLLEKIAEKVAESKVSSEQESEILAQSKCDVKAFLDGVSAHQNISPYVMRQKVTEAGKKKYDEKHNELEVIVRRFVSEFEKEIKDRQTGDTLTGLYSGKRFTSREAHRFDKKVFNRKILPEDIPDMAIGIMVDLSGSMSGSRIEEAIKTVYITYTFCRRLNIPVFVVGHSTDDNHVVLVSVVDEKSLDDKDKYRIFGMDTYSCNRDGYALRYCLKRLEKMQAEQKLLMVISDGRPNHNGYGVNAGKEDCQNAVASAMKKGIFTITAGIGDSEQVRSIYKVDVKGKELSDKSSATYLDLSDLKKLPKSFVKIIKEKLM